MATIKEHSKTIDGVTYTAKTLTTTDALYLLPRLGSLFGDGVVELVVASDEMPDDASSTKTLQTVIAKIVAAVGTPSNLAKVMAKVAETAADPDGIFKGNGLSVLKEMMRGVTADKVNIGADQEVPGSIFEWYDQHFAGRLKHLLAVCVWVGQINFFGPSAASS